MPALTLLGNDFSFTDRLGLAILQFLKTQDRVHLEDYQVPAFKEQILLQIAQINKDHPLLNSCNYYWKISNNSMDCYLKNDNRKCDFKIYASESIFID